MLPVLLLALLVVLPGIAASARWPTGASAPIAAVPLAASNPLPEASATTVNVWVNVSAVIAPSVRSGAGFVWYAAANRFVLFGGGQSAYSTSGLNDTWSYDPAANVWTNVSPIESPSRRSSIPMVYDSRAQRAILFGGLAADVPFERNDTWVFDYANNTWIERSPPDAPPRLASPSMAYDSQADRVILWGGQYLDRPGFSNATWEYDYVNDKWTNLTAGPAPPAGSSAPMTYDPGMDRVVLLPAADPHAYLFDYATKTWTATANGRPAGHSVGGLVYDDFLQVSVLFGGISAGPSWPTDTWTYDGSADAWATVPTVGNPSGRAELMMGYDPTGNRIVVFGGFKALVDSMAADYANDTWQLVRASPPAAPSGLGAIAGSRQVHLSWQAPVSDGGLPVTGYRLYRGTASGAATLLATLGDVSSYTDASVSDGTVYHYNLTAINAAGEGDSSPVVSATPMQLVVTPSASAEKAVVPASVSFSAVAAGGRAPYAYAWMFGDGGTSTLAGPSHLFAVAGNYTIRINVTDAFGTWVVSSLALALANPVSIALFAANVTSGASPLSVQFQSAAGEGFAPYAYGWSFGDGSTSALQNPSHTFAVAGTYHVNLTVTDLSGGTANGTVTVVVSAPVVTPTGPSNPTGSESLPVWLWALPIAAAVALVAFVLWRRRSGKKPPTNG